MSKDRQGPCLGVHYTEVSVLQKYNWCETMKKELTVFRILQCMKRCPINIIDLSLYGEVYCFETLQEKHIPLCSLYKDTLFWF